MLTRRYQIQIANPRRKDSVWEPFAMAGKGFRTKRALRKHWWKWVMFPFSETYVFRMWDTKKNKEILP